MAILIYKLPDLNNVNCTYICTYEEKNYILAYDISLNIQSGNFLVDVIEMSSNFGQSDFVHPSPTTKRE